MLPQFRQYLWICSAGESVDLVDDPLEQVLDNGRGPLQERCCDRGHHALCPQSIEGVLECLVFGRERHNIV